MQAVIYKGDKRNLGRFHLVETGTKLLFTNGEWKCVKRSKLYETTSIDAFSFEEIQAVRELELIELTREELVEKANALKSEGYPIHFEPRDPHSIVLNTVRKAMQLHPDSMPKEKRDRFMQLKDIPFTRLVVMAGGTQSAIHATRIQVISAILSKEFDDAGKPILHS